jgi:3-oxoacyl-[acyl-carrier-protein] synthase II
MNGKNGIDLITSFDTKKFESKYAAEVKDIDYNGIPKRDLLFDSKFINLARVASTQAYKDSKLDNIDFDKDYFGVYISNSMGGVEKVNEGFEILKDKGPSRMSPMLVPAMLPNMASGKVAIDLGAKGSNMATAAACSGGANAIGEAYLKIKHGYEKVMVAGASDASITPFSVACFSAMKVLYRGDNKDEASIPFDKRRSGFVIGEGSAILILEELEHAKARNAKIYAEIVGYGCNCDAYNMVSPDYEGLTCTKAMNRALEEANIKESDISYINAHGTSTSLNDKTETKAINEIFKSKPYVSSTKSMTGHLLSASGAIEALITVKTVETGIMPPMINYKEFDPECDLNFVANKAKENKTMKYAMTNSFGFGGHNVCLIFKKWE